MTEAQHSVVIDVPIAAVYQRWLDVGSFPQFVPAVREVTTTGDVYSHWTLSIAGITREFDAEIIEQLPEERVSWRTITGDVAFRGTATFEKTSPDRTTVTLAVSWTPGSPAERAAAAIGADDRVIRRALHAFKDFVEENGGPSGHSYVTLRAVDAEGAPLENGEPRP